VKVVGRIRIWLVRSARCVKLLVIPDERPENHKTLLIHADDAICAPCGLCGARLQVV
jgi:hypothetical protein